MATLQQASLTPVADLLRDKLGHRPSPATIWRWTAKGVRVGDQRVKLPAVRVGGRLYSTPEAVEEFIREQNPDAEEPAERPEQTRRDLEDAGLL